VTFATEANDDCVWANIADQEGYVIPAKFTKAALDSYDTPYYLIPFLCFLFETDSFEARAKVVASLKTRTGCSSSTNITSSSLAFLPARLSLVTAR
jgi:hypothetical protein